MHSQNVYQIQETLFDKVDNFGIVDPNEQTLFEKIAILDFEPYCVLEESFKVIDTTKKIGKHIAFLVSIFSNLVEEPNLLCNSDLVTSFFGNLEKSALQSKALLRSLFFDI